MQKSLMLVFPHIPKIICIGYGISFHVLALREKRPHATWTGKHVGPYLNCSTSVFGSLVCLKVQLLSANMDL